MKKLIYVVVLTIFSLTQMASANNSGAYISINSGYSKGQTKLKLKESTNVPGSGYSKLSTKNAGIPAAIALGYNVDDDTRAELSLNFQPDTKLKADSMKESGSKSYGKLGLESKAMLANLYYDFSEINENIRPYAMAGLGFSRNKPKNSYKSFSSPEVQQANDSKTKLAYQLGTGVRVKLQEKQHFDLGYRYFNSGYRANFLVDSISSGTLVKKYKHANHQLIVGYSYAF